MTATLHYCDSQAFPAEPDFLHRETAYRQAFLEAAQEAAHWPTIDDDTVNEADRDRLAAKDAAWIGDGYAPDYAVEAARTRGRRHAFAEIEWAFRGKPIEQDALGHWLMKVAGWASADVSAKPPPRIEVMTAEIPQSATVSLTQSPPKRRSRLTRADQLEIKAPDWLLYGILERDTFAQIFGDPGSGKTFLALDWACRIATGTAWRGREVKANPVIYVAGEGQQGIARRALAWQVQHEVTLTDAPLFSRAVAMTDVTALGNFVAAVNAESGPPALIVIDTLARCFGGGDENSTQDMSQFITACDALRTAWGCTVLIVHHTGHADKTRARGAIAMTAALDAEYRLSKTESGLTLTATKMKDAELPLPLNLELVTVDLPGMFDEFDNPVTSAALEV
ncbi:MAG TPA: helicase RepA family protein, partial [Thermoguttaceae bacterium]|nr:helicase RepA family protein [Thermoguttaceae bacterium]